MTDSDEPNVWGLADALTSLRDDLISAQKSGDGKAILFEVEHIDLDLQLVASSKVQGQGGIGWGILSGKLGGDLESVRTQRVQLRLKLAPNKDGSSKQINRRDERPPMS
ncbi:trypco2 family protein [Rhodospira trueperi]|nr:trypco2 family protein [Rhodospira trueperi]